MIRDLQDAVLRIKKEKNAAILAHSYMSPEILEIADVRGDSFQLAKLGAEMDADTVIVCGVRFMADAVKILSPQKKVILPVADAGCPMAEQISPEQVIKYKEENPGVTVVAYINTTTELKAVCDVCVTSSSAEKIISRIPDGDILFLPDYNLGSYIKSKAAGKNITLMNGKCPVHADITAEDCEQALKSYPNTKVLMHPEMTSEALKYADFIGSTSAIIEYALNCGSDCIIGTEKSVADWLNYISPKHNYYTLSKKLYCPDMRVTGLPEVYKALAGTGGEEIVIDEELRLAAKLSIDRMIELGG